MGRAASTGLPENIVAEIAARAGRPDYGRWSEQITRTGGCSRPIRLMGRVLRDGIEIYNTRDEPDGVLLKRCGTRRASVCPSCSFEYAGDMWQLLYAGLAGGRKGVPETVREHPMVFATLTAPSFGAVHSTRTAEGRSQPCRPRRDRPVCPHGRPAWCSATHEDGDRRVGEPLCPDCYDYEAAVLFNWHAPELWRRFTIALRRHLAHVIGVPSSSIPVHLRLSYAKVAEFQRRGIVHFHAIVRLDGPGDDYEPPPSVLSVEQLEDSVRAATRQVRMAVTGAERTVDLGWGDQVDVQPIGDRDHCTGEVITSETVAAYVSKYATKAAEDFGIGDRPLDPVVARSLQLPEHAVRIIETAHRLAGANEDLARLRRWTHMLGFRGHFSTKSRVYSTTLARLRAERTDYQRRVAGLGNIGGSEDEGDGEDLTLVVGEWSFAGRGHLTNGDAALAAATAADAREWRLLKSTKT